MGTSGRELAPWEDYGQELVGRDDAHMEEAVKQYAQNRHESTKRADERRIGSVERRQRRDRPRISVAPSKRVCRPRTTNWKDSPLFEVDKYSAGVRIEVLVQATPAATEVDATRARQR